MIEYEYSFDKIFNVSKESIPLYIKNTDIESVHILKYKDFEKLFRTSYVYKSNHILFEIDKYTLPGGANVVVIKGDKI